MPPKYKKISVPNFPYQVFTQVWDSTGKRSNIQQPTQVISSIEDYKPKDGKAPTDGSPAYTTVFDSSANTFYQVPIYSGFDAVAQEIEEAEPAPTQEATPVQSTAAGVRAKSKNAKKRLPISSMPANAQQYVDHVDENGNVFFRLPEGITNEQFQEALQRVRPQTTSTPLYETTPAQNSNSQNSNSSGEATKSGNPNVRKTEGTPVQTGARYNLYAYPQRQVDVYSIHPDVYAQVLEQLNTQNGGGGQNNRYLISTTPLSVPNGMANDSTYHYIGKDLYDHTIDIPADQNPAYFNGRNTVYVGTDVKLNEGDVQNNRVIGKVTDQNYISSGNQRGHRFVALPNDGTQTSKRVVVESDRRIPSNYSSSDFRDDGSLTAAQNAAYYNNLDRRWVSGYQNGVIIDNSTANELINSIPAENALPAEEEQRGRRNAFQRIGDFFGFHKEGGELNYFNYLKSGGSIHIKPENKGKFTETKKRTGKTTEELTHSKNPITRKRAIFAQNAKKWNHKK